MASGTAISRRYGLELVSKPAILFIEVLGGLPYVERLTEQIKVQPRLNKHFFFFFFFDPPGDPGKKSLSSIHFRLCTSFRPSAERRLCVNLAPPV